MMIHPVKFLEIVDIVGDGMKPNHANTKSTLPIPATHFSLVGLQILIQGFCWSKP